MGADAGYLRFATYVGSYWGARYSERDDVPRSAMAVPDAADTGAVRERLPLVGRVQDVCYRGILLRRELASMLADASPRDFSIEAPEWA